MFKKKKERKERHASKPTSLVTFRQLKQRGQRSLYNPSMATHCSESTEVLLGSRCLPIDQRLKVIVVVLVLHHKSSPRLRIVGLH